MRTNNGMEFCYKEFNEFCKDEDIARQHIVRHTLQQNGLPERNNMTLLERVRCMLLNSRLNRSFWAEAVNTTCYFGNCSLSIALDFKTPIEVWSNKPDDYSMLKVFGCLRYCQLNKGKLEPRAKKGSFMGHGNGVKGSIIWFS